MNGFDFVGAAYSVFVIVLAWDFFASLLKLRQVRRTIVMRVRRDEAKQTSRRSST